MSNRLRISLVIPAYNEESHLADCLRSALAQQLPFYEIIVVDNNSSDATLAIVRQFSGVRVLQESRQGVVFARNRGFDAVSGDIIARIDADTRLPIDWTRHVARAFSAEPTAAITGKVRYYDIALASVLSSSDSLLRRLVARLLGKYMALQGANMAIRRSVWQDIRTSTCDMGGVHEDFDLAIHAVARGHQVRYEPSVRAEVAFRQAASPLKVFVSYYWHCPKTYLKHGVIRGWWMLPVSTCMIASYPALHLLHRLHGSRSPRAIWAALLVNPKQLRVNPATFAD